MLMSPTFHGRSSSLMKPSSQGRCCMFGQMKTHMLFTHMAFSNATVSTWAGFLDGCVIGPYLLPSNLTGDAYLNFLEHILHGLLEDMPLHGHQNMWFQHDGTPPHFTRAVWSHLDQRFGHTWIGHGGPTAWPTCLPDMTPLDYFLWCHMKSLVYEIPVDSEEDLLVRVMAAVDVGLQGIGDRVYVGTVYVLKSLVVTSNSSCKWTRRTTTYNKQQKRDSSTCNIEVFSL